MEAKSTDNKTFQLTENGQLLGELIYKNLFSQKADIKLSNEDLYEIEPAGLFGTSIVVRKTGTEIATLQINWQGQILFNFINGQEFVLKVKSFFSSEYIVENKEREQLMSLEPNFNWRKFSYSYNLIYDQKPIDILFAILGVYAVNYSIACMSAVY